MEGSASVEKSEVIHLNRDCERGGLNGFSGGPLVCKWYASMCVGVGRRTLNTSVSVNVTMLSKRDVIIYRPTVDPCHYVQYKCGHFSTMQMNNSSAFL